MEPRLSRAVAVALEIRDDDWDRMRTGVEFSSYKQTKPQLMVKTVYLDMPHGIDCVV